MAREGFRMNVKWQKARYRTWIQLPMQMAGKDLMSIYKLLTFDQIGRTAILWAETMLLVLLKKRNWHAHSLVLISIYPHTIYLVLHSGFKATPFFYQIPKHTDNYDNSMGAWRIGWGMGGMKAWWLHQMKCYSIHCSGVEERYIDHEMGGGGGGGASWNHSTAVYTKNKKSVKIKNKITNYMGQGGCVPHI